LTEDQRKKTTMHAAHPTIQTGAMFDDLVRDALEILIPITVIVFWIWTGYVVLFDLGRTLYAYVGLLTAVVSGLVGAQLSQRSLRWAVWIYLAGLTATITSVVLAYTTAPALFLYLQVTLVTAMLTNPRTTWAMTTFLALLMISLGFFLHLSPAALAQPLGLLVLTTGAAWLSARRLFTALTWALNMSTQAQRNAEEARDHRGELQRVLTTLDLAYSRLERAHQQVIFAQEAAEKAYRFKSDFVANVSHELRTPLNLIVGFSEMMAMAPESYGGVNLPREYRGDMMAIYRSARHLLDLINDVLDLSQIEAGRMAIFKEPGDLRSIIQEAADIVHGLAEARRLLLVLDLPVTPLHVELDRIRIRQVLLNLLTNAMRYTDEGWVRVTIAACEAEMRVTVADSGRGIAPEKLARAFEAFDRLDEEHLREGTGLGLAVSKKFVELHGGKMWIESEVGRGTMVHFTLPALANTQYLPSAPMRLTGALPPRTSQPLVLVLHEDPRVLPLLQRHVGACQFVLAETAGSAQERLQAALPNAVLVDSIWAERTPQLMQTLGAIPHLPVLICPLPNVHHLGALMGATDFLPKPVTRADLAAALARLAVHKDSGPQTALVVDDDPHIVRLIGRMLKAIDPSLRVMEAFGGEKALEMARSQKPEVIFLDLVMPEVSGYSLIEAVRGDAVLAATALIVVSVRSVAQETAPIQGEVRLARATGFTLTELLHTLQALLAAVTQPVIASPPSAVEPLIEPSG
jgi:signal transduction histidine kinase/DNA-binding response OmpR family regulator